jgi:tetratricopeptide (TPR) repeat protein
VQRSRILGPVAVLVFLWIALPVRLPTASQVPASEPCLTLSTASPGANRADSIARFERCSQRFASDLELIVDLGILYESSGRGAEAEAQYRRALVIEPGDGDVRLRLGRLLLKKGDVPGARRQAEMALGVQPNRRAILDFLRDIQAPQP